MNTFQISYKAYKNPKKGLRYFCKRLDGLFHRFTKDNRVQVQASQIKTIDLTELFGERYFEGFQTILTATSEESKYPDTIVHYEFTGYKILKLNRYHYVVAVFEEIPYTRFSLSIAAFVHQKKQIDINNSKHKNHPLYGNIHRTNGHQQFKNQRSS